MKKIILTLVALLATIFVHAQRYSDNYLKSNPVWIQMMSDSIVNFEEAKHAFEVYWMDRALPREEHELFAASEEAKAKANFMREKNEANTAAVKYAFEYKKFKKWLVKNEAFVKPDGFVMTPDERIQQWKNQMSNRK
jgi:hypothetical protein